MKKIVVASREEALALIAGGTNSMLVFSEEAPYGYKKDGTPAGRRGRHAVSEEVRAAREAERAARAAERTTARPKTGPVLRTEEAPFGVKKDGTPMKKRGRPAKVQVATAEPLQAVATEESASSETDSQASEIQSVAV